MLGFKKYFSYLIGVALGITIPVFFAYLDMWELEIETNAVNLIDMLQSQNIYVFSAGFFPFTFVLLAHLLHKIYEKNEMLVTDFEYLKVILNATPDAIVFLNENKEITFQNNQFRLLFKDVSQIINATNLNEFLNQVEYIQKEVQLDSNVAHHHPFLMSFKLTKYDDRKNYFISFKDLKNLKDKERIIEDQKHQMIEKNKLASLGEMAAGIAHEINNPLTVIHSNNSMVQKLSERNLVTPDRIEKINLKTREQIERITSIITSLRNLSRGMANDEYESFEIRQVLDEAKNLAKIRDKEKKISISFEASDVEVYGNRGQVVQIVLNLMNNAIDAIENQREPWIKLYLEEEDESVSLFITDSGEGIPTEVIDKIFIPMYTTKDVGKGTGLGLSLSRTFAEQNGGTLNYIKDKDHTCFKLQLRKSSDLIKKVA